MAFQIAETVKTALIVAICSAIGVYISSNIIRPHIVTRQNGTYLDNNLVTTYSGFVALVVLIAVILATYALSLFTKE